jgi:ABC-type transport system involved in multi-copper enzyme maturation permease subunit
MLLMAMVAGNMVGQTPDAIRAVAILFQLGLVILVVPSLTAGAITQERERGSLDLLRMSRIRPWGFLRGKLLVAAVFVMFLVVGSLPAWYVIHYLGTNTLKEIVVCWAIILSTMLLAIMAGLLGSAVTRRTSAATAVAYGLLVALSVATLVPFLARERLSGPLRDLLFAFNPFISAIQVLTSGFFEDVSELWRAHLALAGGLSIVFLLFAYVRVRRLLAPEK